MFSTLPLISSTSNSKIKHFLRFRNATFRRKNNAFIVEGLKEIALAVKNRYNFRAIFVCPDLIAEDKFLELFQKSNAYKNAIATTKKVFAKMVYRDSSQGIVAIVERKTHTLNTIPLTKNPCILVVEKLEKPGNLGAILRTADAAGINGIICCDLETDIYNPNVIRASLGTIFSVPLAVAKSVDAISFLQKNKLKIYATSLTATTSFYEKDYLTPVAFVVGAEAFGLSKQWLAAADAEVIIPMYGQADSLNASVTASLLLYEMLRQRSINTS